MDKADIVSRLKNKLNETELPKAWAARQVGITPAYFARIITGAMAPGDDLCIKFNTLLSKIESSGLGKRI